MVPSIPFFSGQGDPLHRPQAEHGEVTGLEMGRAEEVSLSAGGGDCFKDLGEHEGWEGKHQKITQGVNCRCQKGKPGPQHLCVTVVGQV